MVQISSRNIKCQQFHHNTTSTIPRACLDLIKPVFEELCSATSLARVIGGGSQNCNEAFHSLLWTMVPKHRYCSSKILRNNGYESLDKLFTNIFSSMGYYSAECFNRLDAMRKPSTEKVKKRRIKRAKPTGAAATAINTSSSESDDEVPFFQNDSNLADISNELNALELLEDEAYMDYEPEGDD